jgi:hypothetical protein
MKLENSQTITLTDSELNLWVSELAAFEREQLSPENLARETFAGPRGETAKKPPS